MLQRDVTLKNMEKQRWDMLMGSDAIAYAVKCCKPDVIAAYPITPQTHIIEALSEMVAGGEIKGEYIKVESEMTAIAACFGAVAAGSRAFTATMALPLCMNIFTGLPGHVSHWYW